MKNVIYLMLIILFLNENVQAWIKFENQHNNGHPGKCFISDTVILSPGETVKSPNACVRINCRNEQGDTTHFGCVNHRFSGCQNGDPIDLNADFPLCCATQIQCLGNPELSKRYSNVLYDDLKEQTQRKGVSVEPKQIEGTI